MGEALAFQCGGCGACYDRREMSDFAVWRCYDCGRQYAAPHVAAMKLGRRERETEGKV